MYSFVFFLFIFIFYANPVSAETDIYGGVISQDTTWTSDASSSPYVIHAPSEGDEAFSVGIGATLTIEAGTIIKFDYDQSLNIFGKLLVNGSPDNKVYFTSLYDDSIGGDTDQDNGLTEPYSDSWPGIEISPGGSAELSNTNISYAEIGLSADLAEGSLDNTDISNCDDGISVSQSIFAINNSTINNLNGDALILDSTSSASFNSSNVNNVKDDGVIITNNSVLNIENSNFSNISDGFAVACSSSFLSVNSSSVTNVGDGITVFDKSNFVFNNSFVNDLSGRVLTVFQNSQAEINNLSIETADSVAAIFDNSNLILNNSLIRNINSGFNIFENAYAKIQNVDMENVNGGAITVFDGSDLNFDNSTLKDINDLDGSAMVFFNDPPYSTTTLNISSSTISSGNGTGLEIFGNTTANIDKTDIENFSEYGVRLFDNPNVLITNSEISNNDYGILSGGVNLDISDSIISDNASYGILNYETPLVTAINNWWGDASGPFNADTNASGTANQVSENVEFSPWLIDLPSAKPKCCSNVLFIPGLEASRLYKPDYAGGTERLWEPEVFHNNSDLFLDADGRPIRSDIYTKDIIDNAYMPIKGNIYESFISSMNKMKNDGVINDWKAVPYDWRLSPEDLLSSGKEYSDGKIYYVGELASTSNPYIISELRRLASSSATGKVTIIAHSNGGLITKALTEKLGDEASSLIDKIIFVAVPQAGTPAAIGALLHGFQTGLPKDWLPIFMSPAESRNLGKNMSSAYDLLPFTQYFNYISDPAITFDNSDLLSPWRTKYGSTINSGDSLYNFLSDQSREVLATKNDLVSLPTLNKYLLDSAKELHDVSLDSWTLPPGISLTEIAGWGEDTVSGIDYYQGMMSSCSDPHDIYSCSDVPSLEYSPKITSDGDGTVVVPSALWTASSTGVEKYWVDLKQYNNDHRFSVPFGRQHADVLEVPELLSFIQNMVVESSSTLLQYISTSTPIGDDTEKKLHFILHSPLSIDLYDEESNHTGISTTTNQIEENIPGSDYETFGEVKYISVPASSTIYLFMRGYSSGSFSLDIQETQGDKIIASTTFAGVPSSTSTIVTVSIPYGNIASISSLLVDENGDGSADITILPKIDGVAVPNFSKSQSSSARRHNIISIATTTTVSVFASGTRQSSYMNVGFASVNATLKDESTVFKKNSTTTKPFATTVTTSISVFVSKTRQASKNGSHSSMSEMGRGKSSIFTKSAMNDQSLLASVGIIPDGNNIVYQIISTTLSLIKNIINKFFSWYN